MCECKSFGKNAEKEGRWVNIPKKKKLHEEILSCLTVLIFIDHHLGRT